MRDIISLSAVLLASYAAATSTPSSKATSDSPLISGFRPPAVPLIVFDPFMSIWSMSDNLYDSFPQLWCGPIKAMTGAIRVDGSTYRFMGPDGSAGGIPADSFIPQTSVRVEPT